MTDRLDPYEVYAEDPIPEPKPRLKASLIRRLDYVIQEMTSIGVHLPTLPEMSDADEALRALRHLKKQLEGNKS
ncbi:hypothetical protein ACFWY9_28675 [Amycolatopsis sp. NPDC059027]|uniref:hypothetical protein n=1 Tax=Amycolatopsis sp. NPDC059027 TaxID=3346709 RepID=UPI00366E6D05